MLTGKNKERFEEWYSKHPIRFQSNENGLLANINTFWTLDQMFQWGVLQDYADSIGYIVNVYCNASGYLYEIHRNSNGGGSHLKDSGFEADTEHGAWYTMDEARIAAIKAFDEIVNRESRKVNHK